MIFSNVKKLSIPEGRVKRLECGGQLLWKGGHTNLVPTSIDTDGSIFNGCGYKDGYRLSSSGALKEQVNTCVCGLIPAANGDVIRSYGCDWNTSSEYGGYYTYIGFYDADKKWLGSWNQLKVNNGYADILGCTITEHGNGVITYNPNVAVPYSYIRLALWGKGADLVVTVNEEIEL